jgi:hypothetical protein
MFTIEENYIFRDFPECVSVARSTSLTNGQFHKVNFIHSSSRQPSLLLLLMYIYHIRGEYLTITPSMWLQTNKCRHLTKKTIQNVDDISMNSECS